MTIAFLNGEYLPLESARVSPMDRAFLFGDAVYEVIPVYDGKIFSIVEHLARLNRSLTAIKLNSPYPENQLHLILQQLVDQNGGGNQTIYLQISRGVAPIRDHAFPEKIIPTLFAYSMPLKLQDITTIEKGITAITYSDNRWENCYIKSTNLLGNVLARQAAIDAGVQEAIFIREGYAIEGTASNLFFVFNDVIKTTPADKHILGGVTRDFIIQIAKQNKIKIIEEYVAENLIWQANEIWISSTSKEIAPVVKINNKIIGHGVGGPMWRKMINLYRELRKNH